jgi:hypothetical protein
MVVSIREGVTQGPGCNFGTLLFTGNLGYAMLVSEGLKPLQEAREFKEKPVVAICIHDD